MPTRNVKRRSATDRVSKSERAGLTMPVARTDRDLRSSMGPGMRLGANAGVFQAAVNEFLIADILTGVAAAAKVRGGHKPRITARAIARYMRGSTSDMDELVRGVNIRSGGVGGAFIVPVQRRAKRRSAKHRARK